MKSLYFYLWFSMDLPGLDQDLIRPTELLDLSNDAIFIRNPSGTILYWNQGAERLYGWAREDAVGENCHDLLRPVHLPAPWPEMVAECSREGHWNGEIVYRSRTGSTVVVASRWTARRNAHGTITEILEIDFDKTELKQVEEQFYHAQKLESLGSMAGGIAHDFNNILAAIQGASALLRMPGQSADQREFYHGILDTAVHRGTDVVKQLMRFVRRHPTELKEIAVAGPITEVASTARETFPALISFSVIIDENLPLVQADATQIYQVLLNLCLNARDAMPKGGTITIRAFRESKRQLSPKLPNLKHENYICIAVQDTGVGMSETTRRRVLEPYFTTKPPDSGAGLGLAVVAGIIKDHDGFILIDSEIDQGSTFTLYIPCGSNPSSEASFVPSPRKNIHGNGELLLLVDDELPLLQILQSLFPHYGYETLTARDGEEAIQVYKENKERIAVVICDLGLPKCSGCDVILQMQQIDPEVRTILASGWIDTRIRDQMSKRSLVRFLTKPYDAIAVVEMVHSILNPCPSNSTTGTR